MENRYPITDDIHNKHYTILFFQEQNNYKVHNCKFRAQNEVQSGLLIDRSSKIIDAPPLGNFHNAQLANIYTKRICAQYHFSCNAAIEVAISNLIFQNFEDLGIIHEYTFLANHSEQPILNQVIEHKCFSQRTNIRTFSRDVDITTLPNGKLFANDFMSMVIDFGHMEVQRLGFDPPGNFVDNASGSFSQQLK